MRCIRNNFLHHAMNLRELIHQVDLVMQATGCVDDDNISILCYGRLNRVECDRGRIGALSLLNDIDADSLAPYIELLYCGGTKCITRTQDNFLSRLLKLVTQ